MRKLTEKEAERIAKRFNEVAPNARCSLCGHDDFGIPAAIVPLPIQENYPNPFGGASGGHIACAPLICNTCGNTYLLALRSLGGLDDLTEMKW